MATKTMNREKMTKIIGLSLFAIAIVLAFIGCFGDIAKGIASLTGGYAPSVSSTESISFTWLFKDMWDELSSLKDTPIYGVSLVFSIFLLISYILCLASMVGIAIKTLIDFINNKDVSNIKYCKSVRLLVSSVVVFIALLMSYQFASMQASAPGAKELVEVRLGWGPILMMVGAIASLIACAFSAIKDNMDRNEIVALFLKRVTLIILVFIAVFGFKASAQLNVASTVEQGATHGKALMGTYLIYILIKQFVEAGMPDNGAVALTIVSLICSAIMLAAVVMAINEKNDKKKIGYFGAILVLAVIIGVMLQSAVSKLITESQAVGANAAFGEANIVNIVLSAVGLILTCVSMKLSPTQEIKKVTAPKK